MRVKPTRYVLDCDFANWRHGMRSGIGWEHNKGAVHSQSVLPFTFNDVHPVLAASGQFILLRPAAGVKS